MKMSSRQINLSPHQVRKKKSIHSNYGFNFVFISVSPVIKIEPETVKVKIPAPVAIKSEIKSEPFFIDRSVNEEVLVDTATAPIVRVKLECSDDEDVNSDEPTDEEMPLPSGNQKIDQKLIESFPLKIGT